MTNILLSENYEPIDECDSKEIRDIKNLRNASQSLIHFMTNDESCPVRIKNNDTNQYLNVGDKYTDSILIVGRYDQYIFTLKPSYLSFRANLLIQKTNQKDLYLYANEDSTIMKAHEKNSLEAQFYLVGNENSFKILMFCRDKPQMRYVYMTYDSRILTDGDEGTFGNKWTCEKVNKINLNYELRHDYLSSFEECVKISKKNVIQMFSDIVHMKKIYDIESKSYLNFEIDSQYQNDSFMDSIGTKFIIRPTEDLDGVYLSLPCGNSYKNLFTLPKNNGLYFGAPNCKWAKFYIIKNSTNIAFQCFHRETNKHGTYGRYLYVCGNVVLSDGSLESSKWLLK